MQGVLRTIQLDLTPKQNLSVSLTWINQTKRKHYTAKCNGKYCTFTPVNILQTSVSHIYWLFGSILKFYSAELPSSTKYNWKYMLEMLNPTTDSRKNTSWNKAADLCKSVGAHLPYFYSRDELKEFLQFLRHSSHIPPLEGIFIGLHYYQKKVS